MTTRRIMALALLILSGCSSKKTAGDYANTEAVYNIRKLYQGARVYYLSFPWHKHPGVQKQFPDSVAATPTPGSCCPKRCKPEPQLWENLSWKALMFGKWSHFYYSNEFRSSGTDNNARFTARAIGDLDCDGTMSTFEISGKVNADGTIDKFDLGNVKMTNPGD